MAAAGLGSTYICFDHFNVGGKVVDPNAQKLATGLQLVEEPQAKTTDKRRPNGVSMDRLRQAHAMGNAWFAKNFTVRPKEWAHYYYYAYERYQAFRETAEKDEPEEPKWYTDIANELLKTQGSNGAWEGQGGGVPDTSFSILFLIRSTKKAIKDSLGDGLLQGGRGLDSLGGDLVNEGGNFKRPPLSGPAEAMLAILDNPEDPSFKAAVEGIIKKPLEIDDAQLTQNKVRLQKLFKDAKDPTARMVALTVLAKTRDLDQVPLLIEAMKDEDPYVVIAARDALRLMSRKFFGLGPAKVPETPEEKEIWEPTRRKAMEEWKQWYLSIRPHYVFEE
jgi:hypothetical protein